MRKVVQGTLFATCSFLTVTTATAATSLVGSDYPTMVDRKGDASRYEAIVKEAFSRMEEPLTIQVMRQAFVGSALMGERVDGELMFLSMNEQEPDMLYSAPFVPVNLYLASRSDDVVDVTEFYHIEGTRVATENRFANTQELREEKNVKWSRNPAAFDVFRQIGDERANYILADKLLLKEFNRLLNQSKRESLYLSQRPLVQAFMHISLRGNVANAAEKLERFNSTIEDMKKDGTYNKILDVAWLKKDLNSDGIADYITSADAEHSDMTPSALQSALPLDNSLAADSSQFYVDGVLVNSLKEATDLLNEQSSEKRESYLDEARYKRMMQDW